MRAALIQPSFSGGELSPSLHARVDLARYGTSVRRLENFIVRPYGGVVNRPGFRFVGEVKDSTRRTILVPFEFSTDISYTIELGHLYMRFWFEGALLLDGGNSTEVVTPWTEDQISAVRFTQSADVLYLSHSDYPTQELRRTTPTTFSMVEYDSNLGPFGPINIDDDTFVTADSDRGEVTLTSTRPIFLDGHVGGLFRMEQQNTGDVPQWTANTFLVGSGANPFGRQVYSEGRLYTCTTNQNAAGGGTFTGSIRPVHTEGTASDGLSTTNSGGARFGVAWTFIHDGVGIVRIEAVNSPTEATGRVIRRIPDGLIDISPQTFSFTGNGANQNFWMPLYFGQSSEQNYLATIDGEVVESEDGDLSEQYFGYDVQATLSAPAPIGSLVTFRLTAPFNRIGEYFAVIGDGVTTVYNFSGGGNNLGGAYQARVDNVIVGASFVTSGGGIAGRRLSLFERPDNGAAIEVLNTYQSTKIFAFGAWSEEFGYPSEVEFFSDRLTLAASRQEPQTAWFSKPGDYTNHGTSVPVLDDDAITATLNARQINAIRDLIPLQSLLLMTSGGEWRTATGEDDILSPATIAFRPQSYNGSEGVPALIIDDSAVHIERGYKIRSIGYQFERDGYVGDDLTVFSEHLVEGFNIVSWDYQQVPFKAVWAVRDDGVLLSMTYERDQQVVGWARHTTDGEFESVTVVSEGEEDVVYVVVRRDIDGESKRYIERMESRQYANIRDAFFVDSGLTYDGTTDFIGAGEAELELTAASFEAGQLISVAVDNGFNVFAPTDIGDQIVLNYGQEDECRLQIVTFTDIQNVEAVPQSDVPIEFQSGTFTEFAMARDALSGLDHLEGKTVRILADANVHAEQTVSSGQIALESPAVTVHVGLGFDSTLTTLDINNPGQETIRMRKKLIKKIGVLVQESRNIKVGRDGERLEEAEARFDEAYGAPPDSVTGLVEAYPSGTWEENGRITVVQDQPLPITLLGLIPEVEVGE